MSSYLTHSDADAIAATLLGVASYLAADDATKTTALELATARVDASERWQGRKYLIDGTQDLEFPRVADEAPVAGIRQANSYDANSSYVASTIWDWDTTTNTAVVPLAVKRAVVFEADSIINGVRDKKLQERADGLAGQSVGSLSESYFKAAVLKPDGRPTLCMNAATMVAKYVLRGGRIM